MSDPRLTPKPIPLPVQRRVIEKVVVRAKKNPPKTKSGRRNMIKGALEKAAAELIPQAAAIVSATGEQKKAWVRERLLDVIRDLVEQLPDFLEPLAFKGLEIALDGIIQTVYQQLKARGVV